MDLSWTILILFSVSNQPSWCQIFCRTMCRLPQKPSLVWTVNSVIQLFRKTNILSLILWNLICTNNSVTTFSFHTIKCIICCLACSILSLSNKISWDEGKSVSFYWIITYWVGFIVESDMLHVFSYSVSFW